MTASDGPCDFVYVHTDVPDGMTIREWRVKHAANRTPRRRWRLRARAAAVAVCGAAPGALAWLRVARVARVSAGIGRRAARRPRAEESQREDRQRVPAAP
jgi:hypothetical protein